MNEGRFKNHKKCFIVLDYPNLKIYITLFTLASGKSKRTRKIDHILAIFTTIVLYTLVNIKINLKR